MIVSISRRTDIPLYYSAWLENRLKAGCAQVANPFNSKQVRRVSLEPAAVDGLVLWTKHPGPMLQRPGLMSLLNNYRYYVQVTLTPYDAIIEPGLPDKGRVVIPAIQALAAVIGPERLVWRYDPILLSQSAQTNQSSLSEQRTSLTGEIDPSYHLDAFSRLATALTGCTTSVIVSFVDDYRGCRSTMKANGLALTVPIEVQHQLLKAMAPIAAHCGMSIATCAEAEDFSSYGIKRATCIDATRLGLPSLAQKKDAHQRAFCGCAPSVDIGIYNSCAVGCVYCYANPSRKLLKEHLLTYHPGSESLKAQLQYTREHR